MTKTVETEAAHACWSPGKNPLRWPTWALFGNDDDGVIGDPGWNPERKADLWTKVKWWVRNPFHNLTFYVIGFCQVDSYWVKWQIGNWTFGLSGPAGWPPLLPYIGYARKGFLKGYIGWRGCCFGLKLRANSDGL